jgi:hypothetical protein
MAVTVDGRLKKLEAQTSPNNEDEITFNIYLVKAKKDGSILRREYPDGKYVSIDPKLLGIEKAKPIKVIPKEIEPPIAIAVPKEDEIAAHDETAEERVERIKEQIYRDFNNEY